MNWHRWSSLESYVTAIGNADDVAAFMARMKPKIIELEARSTSLKDEIAAMEYRIAGLPDEQEIEARRNKLKELVGFSYEPYLTTESAQFLYLQTGAALHHLPFEAQKKVIRLFFGGKDELGRRYGIYIKDLGGNPRRFDFMAYGKLGEISGWVESKTGDFGSDSDLRDDGELAEGISKVMLDNQMISVDKDSIVSKCHAHHRQRLHQ